MTLKLPIGRSSILGPLDNPEFVVGLLTPQSGVVTKPVIYSPMMGPLVEFIQNFWPLWDNPGSTATDISGANTATLVSLNQTMIFGQAKYGQGIAPIGVGDTLPIKPVVLTGSYSLERLIQIAPNSFRHVLMINDTDTGMNTKYVDGAPVVTQDTQDITISDLIEWDKSGDTVVGLELARIWDRALTSYEVTALAANPYLMFGITQDILDEITTIINFMKPMRSSWSFMYQ